MSKQHSTLSKKIVRLVELDNVASTSVLMWTRFNSVPAILLAEYSIANDALFCSTAVATKSPVLKQESPS